MSLAEGFSRVNAIVGSEPLKILMDNGVSLHDISTDILITLHSSPKPLLGLSFSRGTLMQLCAS